MISLSMSDLIGSIGTELKLGFDTIKSIVLQMKIKSLLSSLEKQKRSTMIREEWMILILEIPPGTHFFCLILLILSLEYYFYTHFFWCKMAYRLVYSSGYKSKLTIKNNRIILGFYPKN